MSFRLEPFLGLPAISLSILVSGTFTRPAVPETLGETWQVIPPFPCVGVIYVGRNMIFLCMEIHPTPAPVIPHMVVGMGSSLGLGPDGPNNAKRVFVGSRTVSPKET